METIVRCTGCNNILSDRSKPCPNCGDVRKSIEVSASDTIKASQELGMQTRDPQDQLRREYQSRTDGIKEGVIDRDLTGHEETIRRAGTLFEPMINFEEETKYVHSLVSALNARLGSSYELEPKEKEDSDFPDRWLVDQRMPVGSEDRRVGVEVTHLDPIAISGLKRDKNFDVSGSIHAIAQASAVAVSKKHKIEPKAASRTYLLLTCPYPITPAMQESFRTAFIATSPKPYFRQVCVAPFKEPCFCILGDEPAPGEVHAEMESEKRVPDSMQDPLQSTKSDHESDVWYFAYGSNLSVDQKEKRTGQIRRAILCRLDDHRFAFNKRGKGGQVYANIVPDQSQSVWGVAYLCNPEAVEAMDIHEGVPSGHYKHQMVEVETQSGETIPALAYVAGVGYVIEDAYPTAVYLDRILKGARHHGLPGDYIRFIESLGSSE